MERPPPETPCRLECAFRIDIAICEYCGGAVKIIARIADPIVEIRNLADATLQRDARQFAGAGDFSSKLA
jgi:hypothetical protein